MCRTDYFARLKASLGSELDRFSAVRQMDKPGMYLYKRPVNSPSGAAPSPLTACGSVLHHCVVFIRDAHSDAVRCAPMRHVLNVSACVSVWS